MGGLSEDGSLDVSEVDSADGPNQSQLRPHQGWVAEEAAAASGEGGEGATEEALEEGSVEDVEGVVSATGVGVIMDTVEEDEVDSVEDLAEEGRRPVEVALVLVTTGTGGGEEGPVEGSVEEVTGTSIFCCLCS